MAEQDYIHMPTLEEYSERFKRFFKFKRSEDGILEVKMHTFDGPVHWSYQMHHAFSEQGIVPAMFAQGSYSVWRSSPMTTYLPAASYGCSTRQTWERPSAQWGRA